MAEQSPPPYDGKKTGAADTTDLECLVEEDGGFHIAYWVDKNVRQTFIRKVYSIITLQLLVTVGIVALFTFSHPTKVDLTTWRGFFCIMAIVFMVTGIATAIVLSCKYMYWLDLLYAAISAVVFTLFLAYDTQLLLGNRKYAISPEDYIYGAIQIYVDVIYIFLSFTRLVGRN